MTLGLAEVEERVRALRRRLNSVTVQHGAYVSASGVVLLAAALIVVGVRGSAVAFRTTTWLGSVVALGVIAASALRVRRRWMDEAAAAHLADRRGQLTDRLTTLLDLRMRPRPSRLAPVLVGQTLALGDRWLPVRIAPRRVPRSVFLLVASGVLLASTVFLERQRQEPPPPPAANSHAGTAALDPAAALKALPAPADAAHAAGPDAAGSLGASALPSRNSASGGDADLQARGDTPAPPLSQDNLPALPDRLQSAIRQALHAEPMGEAQQLAARSDRQPGDPGSQRERTQDGEVPQARPGGDRDPNRPGSDKRLGGGQQAAPGEGKRNDPHAQPNPNNPNQKFDGAAPQAGEGSSPGGLMDGAATAQAGAADGPKTFKLTITSFLHAVEQKTNQPNPKAHRISTAGAASERSTAPATLNEQQLNDDALRKAEVPAEYEEIVRRVYSLRAEP